MMIDTNKYLTNFIEKANKLYDNFYSYDQFVWTGAQSKGIIICPNHGPFEKSSEKHISRQQGCPLCSKEKQSKNRTFTVEQFSEKATKVHGIDKFNYIDFVYVDSQTKGKIRCIEHNIVFEQTPAHHLQGHSGCKLCIQQKNKDTQLTKYGAEHHSQTKDFKEKVKKTSMERFGVEHRSKAADFKEVVKATSLKKYGVENAAQLQETKDKTKVTNQERYGVDHFFQFEGMKGKTKQTINVRHGVDFISQVPEVKEKRIQTTLGHYGVENPSQSPEIQERKKLNKKLSHE